MAAGLAGLHRAGDLDRAREQQQLFGQRGFAGVGVGNDGKGAAAASFGGVGHRESKVGVVGIAKGRSTREKRVFYRGRQPIGLALHSRSYKRNERSSV